MSPDRYERRATLIVDAPARERCAAVGIAVASDDDDGPNDD